MPQPTVTLPRAEGSQTYTLAEYTSIEIAVPPSVAADIHADGHVSIGPLATEGQYEVHATHKVGVLRYGTVELRIVPKVSVARLLYLASFHSDPRAWRQVETLLDEAPDPLSAIANALAFHAESALRPAPLQGYVTHETGEKRFRGRLLFDRQLARHAGVLLPVELRYDDYEVGIPENRVLKAAIGLVERHTEDVAIRRRLAHMRFQLDGVEPWPIGVAIPAFSFGRMNERYRPVLALARLVLEQRSLEFPQQRQRGTGFLFNMNRVFETYLESELRRELVPFGGRVDGQRPMYLDEQDGMLMKPDVTWWLGERCLAVVDAKYKRTTSDDHPNADAYQMLAYCTRLGLSRGFLVYADLDGAQVGTTIIQNSGTEVMVTALDIGGSLDQLKASVAVLGVRISESV